MSDKKDYEEDNLKYYQKVERSIITTYRSKIWAKFIKSIKDYNLIQPGDKIAVCMSGGKDSMLLAKCFQELKAHGEDNFNLEFLCMNPGYNKKNKETIISNCEKLNVPLTMFETDIFDRVERIGNHACYLCARMRRGYLYEKAKALGCNKIALGHHFDDVIETTLMGMFYAGQFQTMLPRVKSTSHPGMELIRPLYLVKEADIISWRDKNELKFINCACRFTENENKAVDEFGSKREEIKKLIEDLRKTNPTVDKNIFQSLHNVNLETIISYHKGKESHNFLDDFSFGTGTF